MRGVWLITLALLITAPVTASADDNATNAAVGGAIGGAVGSLIGSKLGGRDGAVVGASVGAATGAALATDNGGGHHQTAVRTEVEVPVRHSREIHCPPGLAKQGRCREDDD